MRCSFPNLPGRYLLVAGIFVLSLAAATSGRAQTPTAPAASALLAFTGAVFSQEGLPLPGATVTVTGPRQIPAIANADGFFILQLPMGVPVQFVVAYPGFATQQIELRAPEAEKNLVVTLVPLVLESGKSTRSRRSRNRPG